MNSSELSKISDPKEMRSEFLLEMYKQLLNDINRHIIVVWQSVGSLVATVAFFALAEKNIIPLYIAITMMIMICAWVAAHVYDASYWYNRNLVMIANIERLFLKNTDAQHVHYYFVKHRKTGSMIMHLRLQLYLAAGFAFGAVALSFKDFNGCAQLSEVRYWLPATTLGICIILILWIRQTRNSAYLEFLKNSPGIEVTSDKIEFGVGHPVEHP